MSWFSGLVNAGSSLFGGSSGGSSGGSIWSSLGNGVSNYFSSGSGWSDIFKGVLGGAGAAGASASDAKSAKELHKYALEQLDRAGYQQRKTADFEAQLLDFYKRADTMRNRKIALDSYGQFSKISQYNPNYVRGADAPAPVKPTVT